MIEKWVNFKRDYLEISFLREKWVCAISPYHRRHIALLGSYGTALHKGVPEVLLSCFCDVIILADLCYTTIVCVLP